MSELEGGSDSGKPNLTPILDMVFQLITFFMLVINFKAASMDLSLKLPVVGSARPVDTKGQVELLVLNIDSSGKLNVYGAAREIGPYIANEAEASKLSAKREIADFKDGDDLPTTVVIRADRKTRFKELYHVIETCQKYGFRKFALKAMNKDT